MVHALLIAIALTGFALDRIIVRHAVTFDDGRGATPAKVPGTEVLNSTGARLDSEGVGKNVSGPIAGSAIVLCGAFAATHLACALLRLAANRIGVSNRSVARGVLWKRNRVRASSRIRDVLVRSGGKYMPAEEVWALVGACVAATLASAIMALWIQRKGRLRSGGGVLRNRVRIVNATIWIAMGVLMVPRSKSGI